MWNPARALILAAMCLAATLPAPKSRASAVPTPEWAKPLPVELRNVEPIGGVEELLWESQTWVSGARVVSYRHIAWRPVSVSGLAAASKVSLVYDRTFHTYAWHMIRIRRGDAVIDALPSAEIEPPVDAFEGSANVDEVLVTAVLSDVRVGDVVEYAYSLEGAEPAFGGRFADHLELAGSRPIGLIQHRLLWPADRPLHIRAHGTTLEPERARDGDRDVYVWRASDTARRVTERYAPSALDVVPWIQLSDFASWSDVAEWARPHYPTEGLFTPELERLAESFRAAGSKSDAVERAARFVQEDVRYRDLRGEDGFRPQPPDLVAARRFGDCKDKSLLLLTLLRLLDVEAVPVLVSDAFGAAVQDRLPSPYAFDHVIVRATLDDRPVWIDATVPYERGPLGERSVAFGVGLPIAAGVVGLESIPEGVSSGPTTIVRETFELPDLDGPAVVHVSTLFRGSDANLRRAELADADRGDPEEASVDFYASLYGSAHIVQPFVVRDDEVRNEIQETGSYAIDELWRGGAAVHFWSIELVLRTLRSEAQKMRRVPLALEHPHHIVHEIEVLLPGDVKGRVAHEVTEAPGVESHYRASSTGSRLRLRHEYRTLAAQVGVEDLARYGAAADRIDRHSAYWIDPVEVAFRPLPRWAPSPTLIAATMTLIAWVGWLLESRRVRRRHLASRGKTTR